MTRSLRVAAVPLGVAALLAPAASQAQTGPDWKFQGSIYGYFPSMGGTTTFPAGSGGSSATIDASTILDNLKFAFMGALEATNGPYGVYTDVIYLNLGNDKSASRDITIGGSALPAGAAASIDYSLEGWLWTLAGTWRAASTPTTNLEVLGGTRMLDIEQTLTWQLSGNVGSIALADRAGNRSAGLQNWDAIVGVKGRASIAEGDKWFLQYYADIGTGESRLTWQAMAGVGYAFGWGDVVGVWRYIDYDMKPGHAIESINFSGPAIAAVFRW
jgi:hypothetical protein